MESEPSPNSDEVDDYKWINWADFIAELRKDKTNIWSFWCKDQVKRFDRDILNPYIGKT